MKHFLITVLAFLLAMGISYAQEDYDKHNQEVRERFKQEDLLHRLTKRYEINPGFSKYSVGPVWSGAVNGWEQIDQSIGFRVRSLHKEAQAQFTKGNLSEDAVDTSIWNNRLHLGYFTPLRTFSIGQRYMDVKGYLIQPAISLGYTYSRKSHGLYVAPAVHFQVPFGLVELRAHTEFTVDHGLNIYPEFSLQLDALRTLLDPKTVKTGAYNSEFTTVEPLGRGWYKITTTETHNNVYIQDVGPFWGITPRIGYASQAWAPENYNSVGLGISGRLNFLGADLTVSRGKLVTGVVPNVQALDNHVRKYFDNEQVLGLVSTTEISVEGLVNIPGLVMNIIRRNALTKMGWKTTPLNRFNFHLGYTYINPGNVEYYNEKQAIAYTDNFFTTNPNIERNAINDPLQHENEWAVSYGVSYEMGAVGVRVNNKLSKTAGRGTTIDFYYILPVKKIINAYK